MRTRTVKLSEIAASPELRFDAEYWLAHKTPEQPKQEQTPDEAIDLLRSLVFEYERKLTEQVSQDTAENITEDYHAALVMLQRFVDDQILEGGSDEETLP
jgi:ferritin